MLEADQGDRNTNAYLIISPMIACVLYLLGVQLASFLEINGGVCQFFIIYGVPIWLHIKCSYMRSNDHPEQHRSTSLPQQYALPYLSEHPEEDHVSLSH